MYSKNGCDDGFTDWIFLQDFERMGWGDIFGLKGGGGFEWIV